jgi:hypothetical protein
MMDVLGLKAQIQEIIRGNWESAHRYRVLVELWSPFKTLFEGHVYNSIPLFIIHLVRFLFRHIMGLKSGLKQQE